MVPNPDKSRYVEVKTFWVNGFNNEHESSTDIVYWNAILKRFTESHSSVKFFRYGERRYIKDVDSDFYKKY